jgi:hypothetical protein
MRASLALKSASAESPSARDALLSSSILCNRLYAITGNITLSWKFPDCPAIAIVASFPITCAATIVTASGITGFTLPGMMLLPGCSAGNEISPSPASGPLFIQRRSLAIFISDTASVRSCPDNSTAESCADIASK